MASFQTHNHKPNTTMRKLTSFIACVAGAFAAAQVNAQTNVISDPVGFYKVTINAGANFISAPLHKVHAYRGLVSGVSGNTVTFSNAAFTVNAFGPADGFAQYIALIKKDNNTNAPTAGNAEGDWWKITANGTNSVTLNPAQGAPTSFIGVGDQIEIRKLVSMRDLFGYGPSGNLFLNKDFNGAPNAAEEDVIRLVVGTSFSSEIFYVDASVIGQEGYIVDGNGPFTGDTITIEPDEPIMLFRKTGSASTNITTLGQVQTTKLTHYLQAGANTVASAYPANALLSATGLKEAGFIQDSNGASNPAEEDVIRLVSGSSFSDDIFLHDGSLTATPPIWIVNGNPDDGSAAFSLAPAKGYIFQMKTGGSASRLTWRQNVPFTP
jgi:uncharacterized protein (TIGR02597 family)